MAGAQGNPSPKDGQGTDAPEASQEQKYVTIEQLNAAITDRFGSFEKRLAKAAEARDAALTEKLTGSMADLVGKGLEEKLAALKPKDEPKAEGKDGKPPTPKLEETPEWKALQADLLALKKSNEALAKRNAEAEQRATTERAKARDVALRQRLFEALGKVGITGERAEIALGHLVDSKRAVSYDGETEHLLFGEGDEKRPLADGLAAWAKTPTAKHFLPPVDAKGSGSPPGGGAGGAKPTVTDADLTRLLQAHAAGGLG